MYEGYWKRWSLFCNEKHCNQYSTSINIILEFLQSLVDQGLGYNSINSARSALSLIVAPIDKETVGNHHLVTRFLKGVFQSKPPTPKYNAIWDPADILTTINNMNINEQLSLSDLSKKLVSLLMLTTGQRVQTIHSIRRSCITFTKTGVTITIPDLLKTSAPGRSQPIIQLDWYKHNSKLCVVKTLKEYVTKTAPLTQSDELWITFIKPFKNASKATLARWLKDMLSIAQVDTSQYTAHSFRHASTSTALKAGVNIDVIFKNAGWSNRSSVLNKFYNKPITSVQVFLLP